jgi:ribosomal protein S21
VSKVNVRVESKNYNPHASPDEKFREFKKMFTAFKKLVSIEGVMASYKQHEHYESKSRKKRRKQREAELARMKGQLRENFFEPK